MSERMGKRRPKDQYRYSFFPDFLYTTKIKKMKSSKKGKKGVKRKVRGFYRYSQSTEATALNNALRKEAAIDKAGWYDIAGEWLGTGQATDADLKWKAKMEKQLYGLHPRNRKRVKKPSLESNYDCKCASLVVVLTLIFLVAIYVTFRVTGIIFAEQEANSSPASPELPYDATETNQTAEDKNATSRAAFVNQYACVYHVAAEGLRVDDVEYALSLFPMSYCQLALYCCAALNSRLEPVPRSNQPDRFDQFLRLTLSEPKPKLTAKLIISLDNNRQFRELLERPSRLETLGKALTVWCLWHGYSGVFLRSSSAEHGLDRLALHLGRALRIVGLTAGLVLREDEHQWSGLHLNRLAHTLGDFSILVEPSLYPPQYFKGLTFR